MMVFQSARIETKGSSGNRDPPRLVILNLA